MATSWLCRHRLGCTVGGASPPRNEYDVVVPHHPAVGRLDDTRLERGDEPPIGVGEVGGVGKGQVAQVVAVCGLDDGSRRLLIHAFDPATIGDYAGSVGAKTSIWPSFSRTSNFGNGGGAVGS